MWLRSYFREKSIRKDVVLQKDIIKEKTGFEVDKIGRMYKVVFVKEDQTQQIVMGMCLNELSEKIKNLYPDGYPLNGFNMIPEFVNLEALDGPKAKGSYLCVINPVADTETYIITPQVAWVMRILRWLLIVAAAVAGVMVPLTVMSHM